MSHLSPALYATLAEVVPDLHVHCVDPWCLIGSTAALLLGAAEGIWDVVGMSETGNPFAFAPSRSDGLQQARELLGKQRFRDLFRQGSQLGLDELVVFALEPSNDDPQVSWAPVEPSP